MIAYKWVIKKDNKYYPLINFGIDHCIKNIWLSDYKTGEIYQDPINLAPYRRLPPYSLERMGYHFWATPINSYLEKWNYFLNRFNQPKINCVLKCEIWDIIGVDKRTYKENLRIVANKFKVLGEIK